MAPRCRYGEFRLGGPHTARSWILSPGAGCWWGQETRLLPPPDEPLLLRDLRTSGGDHGGAEAEVGHELMVCVGQPEAEVVASAMRDGGREAVAADTVEPGGALDVGSATFDHEAGERCALEGAVTRPLVLDEGQEARGISPLAVLRLQLERVLQVTVAETAVRANRGLRRMVDRQQTIGRARIVVAADLHMNAVHVHRELVQTARRREGCTGHAGPRAATEGSA